MGSEMCIRDSNKTLYLLMIDYEKAFDSISHTAMLSAIRNQGVRGKVWRILEHIYENATASIRLETRGPKFPIQRGVRQGDPLSPVLFTVTLEEIFRCCNFPPEAGINIVEERLLNLRFADDITIFEDCLLYTSPSPRDLSTSRMPSSA